MISKKAAALGAVVIVVITAFFSSFLTFQVSKYIDIQSGNRYVVTKEVYQLLEKYQMLEEVRQTIEKDYIEQPDQDKLMVGAIKGMTAALGDPYTTYFTAKEYKEFIVQTQGSYAGVGLMVTVDENDNLITVVRAFKDSPAAKAGIQQGDKIIKVENVEVSGSELEKAVSMMKGEPGTKVNITILRDGQPLNFTLERAVIEIPDMEYKMIGDGIGYIWLYQFDENSPKNFKKAVEDLKGQGMKGLILDLRGNPGGLLQACTEIADMLLPEGLIVYSKDRQGRGERYYSDKEYLGIPLVVLVNEYSASASEVLSGAIQDYGVGTIIGKTTFGKGLVQGLRGPFRDGSALKITIAKYFTPKGRDIHQKGVVPDIEVDLSEEAKKFLKENPGKELPTELDAQLQKGIEEIKKMLSEKK
ncbi:carboxyl-terminal processing protease [Caldicoprobacter guelmensis]|uniref:S41 family peptidase n=1 Tax=Caldicoprobacter guelmensis TaxID=1170224 RepID=UPI001959B9A3|nr:S41 family peptidase [Caldicoprobacter guelmensis]MBM7582716.1 carboxyl-terminal processing protease [Caldicoprobacter guelmensis]